MGAASTGAKWRPGRSGSSYKSNLCSAKVLMRKACAGAAGGCTACPAGKHSSVYNADVCTACESGRYAVRSVEGAVLRWPREAALKCGTLKNWIEDTGGEDEFSTVLPAKDLETLGAVCAHDGDEMTQYTPKTAARGPAMA